MNYELRELHEFILISKPGLSATFNHEVHEGFFEKQVFVNFVSFVVMMRLVYSYLHSG